MTRATLTRKTLSTLRALARALLAVFVMLAAMHLSPLSIAYAVTTRLVSTTGSDVGDCSMTACATITYAIGQSGAGDTISVATGTYTQTGVIVDKNLTIQGAGASSTIVQAAATPGTATDRVFVINLGVTATIQSMTIRNGNTSSDGGGILNNGTLTLNSVAIRNNTASGTASGGGVMNNGTLTITNSTLSGNSSLSTTSGTGGGGLENLGTLTLIASTLSGNSALISGGGLRNDGGTATINNSTFSGNTAAEFGGGIRVSSGTVTLYNSTIVSNTADSDNNGTGDGGGVFFQGTAFNIQNTLIANNADLGGQAPDCGGSALNSLDYNLIRATTGCTISGTTTNNITGLDPQLGPLVDNGGSTQTHALLAGSPAIDAGNPATPGSGGNACLATDQRGVLRPQGTRCDIGAFEAQVALTLTKTVNTANPNPGQRITYTLTITNSSALTATNAVISDTLPAGLTFAGPVTLTPPGAGTVGTPPTLVSSLTISPGLSISVTFPVTVNTGVVSGTLIVNNAAITSTEVITPVTGSVAVTVFDSPITGLAAANNSPTTLGNATFFTATITGGTNVTYTWNFGDSTTGSGANTTHTYAAIGSYTARVTATNSVGSVVATTPVTITDVLISGLSASNSSPTFVNSTTVFTATISAGSNVAYSWNFGDGTTGSGITTAHVYSAAGVYTATVTATNSVSALSATTPVTIISYKLYLPLIMR